MARLIFLGTSNAISDEIHENTHMVLVGEKRTVLIDCPNNPLQRFKKGRRGLFPDKRSGLDTFSSRPRFGRATIPDEYVADGS